MPAKSLSGAFAPQRYIAAFPPPMSSGHFVVPTYFAQSSGDIILEPKAFMVALADGTLHDALMASVRTRHLIAPNRNNASIKLGFKSYSSKSLAAYHSALVHFLAWSEMRGQESGDMARYSFRYIRHYRTPRDFSHGSLEEYEADMKDKRKPGLRSTNPSAIQTRIMVANAFISFCLAQGLREEPFSPYLPLNNNSYLDRDEFPKKARKVTALPEIEVLAEFVRGQEALRDRVAAGLMVFGGLRVDDMLPMRLSDVPRRLEIKRVGLYRVELMVFGKGRKWRTTTIPEWVYNDLREFASIERTQLRKFLLGQELKLPMGNNAPVFVSIRNTDRFGERLSSKFVRAIFDRSVLHHPHAARHAFASWRMIELLAMQSDLLANVTRSEVSEIGLYDDAKNTLALEMGHTNTESTDVYLEWARRRLIDRDGFPDLLTRIQKVHHEK